MDYSDPITVNISPGVEQFIYRDESRSLKRLRFFPKLFLGITSLYLFFAYLAFSRSRKSEQNLVWNGMAKETAHQLGTPLSALFGWTMILEEEGVKSKALNEIKKDLLALTKHNNKKSLENFIVNEEKKLSSFEDSDDKIDKLENLIFVEI